MCKSRLIIAWGVQVEGVLSHDTINAEMTYGQDLYPPCFPGSNPPRLHSQVAMLHPTVVAKCNDEMETLITDSNRSIATLAITTLLKTGNEHSIERLMKQISSFMSEVGEATSLTCVLIDVTVW